MSATRKNYAAAIEALLAPWGVWRAGEHTWRSCCPLHGGDNPTTFIVDRGGQWRCWKQCGGGDLITLVMRVQHVGYRAAAAYVEEVPEPFHEIPGAAMPPFEERGQKAAQEPGLREADVVLFRNYCPNYLLHRGFSRASLQAFDIGYDRGSGRITLPARDVDGRLVGMTYRSDYDDRGPKYWHDHFNKAQHLWGFYKWAQRSTRRLYLVEGQLDVVRMYQLGMAAVAIMGSALGQTQRDLLVRRALCDNLVLAFDNDAAGRQATRKAIRALAPTRFGRRLKVADYPTEDPGELREYHHVGVTSWTNLLFKDW